MRLILLLPQKPAFAAALSVAPFAEGDHIAGTVTMKSMGVDLTILGDNLFSRTLMKCVCRHDRNISVKSSDDSPSLTVFDESSSFLADHVNVSLDS